MSGQNVSNQKVEALEQIFSDLKDQALKSNKPVSKIIKIKGADSIVLQLNAVPNGNNVRFSLTVHRASNFKKQIGVVTNDATSLEAIAKFLNTFKPVLDKYVSFSVGNRRNNNVVEVDVSEVEEPQQEEQQQQQKKSQQKKSRNVEEEF